MTSAFTSTSPQSVNMQNTIITGFRLGEDDLSDASDSDQSAQSECSLSPNPLDASDPTAVVTKKTRSKKRRQLREERKQVNALTDDLGTLLGDAFQKPSADAGAEDQATGEQTMEIEAAFGGKRMTKRTRQNLAKAAQRAKRAKGQAKQQVNMDKTQIAAADRRNMSLDAYRLQKEQKQKQKRNPAQATREKRERKRAKKAAAKGDAMEIV